MCTTFSFLHFLAGNGTGGIDDHEDHDRSLHTTTKIFYHDENKSSKYICITECILYMCSIWNKAKCIMCLLFQQVKLYVSAATCSTDRISLKIHCGMY